MFYKIKCPHCGRPNPFGMFRNRFRIQCDQCSTIFQVDGGAGYWVELVLFIPIYLFVAAFVESVGRKWLGIAVTYWHVLPIVVVAAWVFHGIAFPKLASVIELTEQDR